MKSKNVKIRTSVKAGGISWNHNKSRIRTGVKAGGISWNHNSTRR